MRWPTAIGGLLLTMAMAMAVPVAGAAAAPTVAAMKNHRRVLIVATPSFTDARLLQQRRALAGWRGGAAARDLSLVEVSRGQVRGAADPSQLIRRQWRLPPGEFQVVLVSKDGHEVLRSPRPVAARTLQRLIDAMPMRRAGQR